MKSVNDNIDNTNEMIHYWNYFSSLCTRLDNTKQYIDHSSENNVLKNGKINSWEFQQIIYLAAMEFESICKQLCLYHDSTFNVVNANIRTITKNILNNYSKITETKIRTDYQTIYPLKEWEIVQDTPNSKEYVAGLSWWDDYDNLKHRSFQMFELATLENAVNAMASLMVVELYLMKQKTGDLNVASNRDVKYFRCDYLDDMLVIEGEKLPDFV